MITDISEYISGVWNFRNVLVRKFKESSNPNRRLSDILHRCNIKLNSQLLISIPLDIVNGLLYLRKMGVQQRIITSEDVMVN